MNEKNAAARRAPAAAPAAAAAAPAAAAPNFDALDAASDKWVEGQNADIDRQKEQGLASGMSNMISSGLAGTTVVGGMTAGVNEAATRAKTNVAGQAATRKEGLKLQYANLSQAAADSAANRALSASEGAANRANSLELGSMSASAGGAGVRPSTSTPGLDAFGKPMSGSMQQKMLSAQQPSGPAGGQSGGMGGSYPAIQTAVKDAFSFWN